MPAHELAITSRFKATRGIGKSGLMQQGWADLRPRRFQADKLVFSALRACISGSFEETKPEILLFAGHPESFDIKKSTTLNEYPETVYYPLNERLFWREFVKGGGNKLFVFIGTAGEVIPEQTTKNFSDTVRLFRPNAGQAMADYFQKHLSIPVRNYSYEERFLVQEKPGRFFALEIREKTVKEITKWLGDDPKLMTLARMPLKAGWGVGGIFMAETASEEAILADLSGCYINFREIWGALDCFTNVANAVQNFLAEHQLKFADFDDIFLCNHCVEALAVFAQALVDCGANFQQIHFPDVLWGYNPIGHIFRFLAPKRSKRRLLLSFEENESLRVVALGPHTGGG